MIQVVAGWSFYEVYIYKAGTCLVICNHELKQQESFTFFTIWITGVETSNRGH